MAEKLLLINPPFPRKVSGVPLQLLYLASAVREGGIDVQLLDLDIAPDGQRESSLDDRLRDFRPTHVGVTAYSPNYPESLDIMQRVKDTNPLITVISGGPHQTAVGAISKKPDCIDHVVTSSFGENDLLEIMGSERRVLNRATLFPAYDLLESSSQYSFDSSLFNGKKMTQVLTATGCNQTCNFCSAQQEYTPFSNEIVVGQLQKVIELGYSALFFNDPNFTNPSKGTAGEGLINIQGLKNAGVSQNYNRVLSLMQAFTYAKISSSLEWGCQTKASLVNPFVLDAMANAGCTYITFALEATDDSILKDMRKGITTKHVDDAISMCKERGIRTGLYVMFGQSSNEEADMQSAVTTLDHVERLHPNYLSISVLANYPMIDRMDKTKRLHTHLDYAKKKYSRESVWLNFDEGWGAFHPNNSVEQAQRYLSELDRRKAANPAVWDSSRPGAIRRF
jgi:radical SAM superfamily enzyme YgiQ (UPF0313 family)